MNTSLFNAEYFAANEEDIRTTASGGVGNFNPTIADGGLVICRGVDAASIGADTYELPTPLQNESMADYRARIEVETVAAFDSVKSRTPTEAMHFSDELLIHECRKMDGWPKPDDPI